MQEKIKSIQTYYQSQIKHIKEQDSSVEEFSAREYEWEVERNMLMSLVEKNQEYTYNAQEKCKTTIESKEKEIEEFKSRHNDIVTSLQTENTNLK